MKTWNHKWKDIFWGVLFVATAAFIVFMKLGYVEDVSVAKIIFSVIFGGIMLTSIPTLNFTGILFPAAFICIMFSDEWGIDSLTPVPVLVIALLGSIGLSLIFKKHKFYKGNFNTVNNNYDDSEWNNETIEGEAGEVIECEARFNGAERHITSENFSKAIVRSSFGGIKIYFDNCKIPSGRAEICLDSQFGGVELYIPRNWKIIVKAENSYAGLNEKNSPQLDDNSPAVLLTGNVNFSGVEIFYQ